MEDEVALSALKREALTLYDNLRDLEQRRDELEEEEKHRGTPAQERERLLEQVGTSLFDNAPNYLVPSLGRYPKGILLISYCHIFGLRKTETEGKMLFCRSRKIMQKLQSWSNKSVI